MRESAEEKLQRGRENLATGSTKSNDLSVAFIALHSAMEDRFRELLAESRKDLSSEITDLQNFSWKDIVDLAEASLGLSRSDGIFLMKANYDRNQLAHGGKFEWTRDEVCQYEQFIRQLWATGSRSAAAPRPVAAPPFSRAVETPPPPRAVQSTRTYPPYESIPKPVEKTGPRRHENPATNFRYEVKWYRQTWFYWFTFFFLPPIWALLILSERNHVCLVRAYAFLVLITSLAGGFYFWRNPGMIGDLAGAFQNPIRELTGKPVVVPTFTVEPTQSHAKEKTNTPPFSTSQPAKETSPTHPTTCKIVWGDYPGDDLGNKSRWMVWDQIVSKQVAGSGMEATQFYKEVVEHNPGLAEDGYEFKHEKNYQLPQCR